MTLVKKLLGGAVVSTILGVVFAALLINAHFCLAKAVDADDPKKQSTCYIAKLAYFILLGTSVVISVALSVTGWVIGYREKTQNDSLQSDEVLYYTLSSPEEEDGASVRIEVSGRRDSVEDSQLQPNPYLAFPPAAMYAH